MKRLLLALILFAATAASAQSPVLRAHIEPARGIIVGQPVHLIVEVLVPNYFTGTPDFPTFEIENVIVVLPEDTPQNFNDQVGSERYAGIRRSYIMYPQQQGDFRLPPAKFSVPYAKVPPKTTQATLTLPALTFHADIPAAARDLDYFLPTSSLTMQQRWSAPLKNLRVGDSIERTITITTARMQGMLIPPVPMEAPDGIRVYPGEPKVENRTTNRNEFIAGTRTQSGKYFIQKAGDYTLPAIEITWWNLNTNRAVEATLPAIHFTAAPNPDYVTELPPAPEVITAPPPKPVSFWGRHKRLIVAVPILLTALAFLCLAFHYLPRLILFLVQKRNDYRHSEAFYFRNLIRACRHNNADAAYQNLLRWLSKSHPQTPLTTFLQQTHDDQLTQQVNVLTQTLFAKNPPPSWKGRTVASLLRRHRKTVDARQRHHTHLPALNP